MTSLSEPLQSAINADVIKIAGAEEATQAAVIYTVVAQVKSFRVVYFTTDPDYVAPQDGDWYYVSSYSGPLPPQMTLRNCWGWRFNGGVFTDAREDNQQPAHEALLENNRRALLRILQDKIDQLRKPYQPACLLGHEIRQYKHAEARAFVSDGGLSTYPFLEGVAVAHSFSPWPRPPN